MSAFKRLNNSDVIITPYTANKQWSFNSCDLEANGIKIYSGKKSTGSFDYDNSVKFNGEYECLVYDTINQLYYQQYSGSILDNLSNLHGTAYLDASIYRRTSSFFDYAPQGYMNRSFPTGSQAEIKILSINKSLYGTSVHPGSFALSGSLINLVDDSNGNIFDTLVSTQVGNIFYKQGMVIITNPNYQSVFPVPPYAKDDYSTFKISTFPKIVYPLVNDNADGWNVMTGSISLSGSNASYFTNLGDGTLRFNVSSSGTYDTYYTYTAYKSGSSCLLTSNIGHILVDIPVPNCSFTFSVTDTTPTTTTTSTTTTSTTAVVPTTSTTTSTTTPAPTTSTTTSTTTNGPASIRLLLTDTLGSGAFTLQTYSTVLISNGCITNTSDTTYDVTSYIGTTWSAYWDARCTSAIGLSLKITNLNTSTVIYNDYSVSHFPAQFGLNILSGDHYLVEAWVPSTIPTTTTTTSTTSTSTTDVPTTTTSTTSTSTTAVPTTTTSTTSTTTTDVPTTSTTTTTTTPVPTTTTSTTTSTTTDVATTTSTTSTTTTDVPTTTSTTTSTTTAIIYDYYLADEYDCSTCILSNSNVPVAFPTGTGYIGTYYYQALAPNGYVYKITNTTSAGVSLILSTFGAGTSCATVCGTTTTSTTSTTTTPVPTTTSTTTSTTTDVATTTSTTSTTTTAVPTTTSTTTSTTTTPTYYYYTGNYWTDCSTVAASGVVIRATSVLSMDWTRVTGFYSGYFFITGLDTGPSYTYESDDSYNASCGY